MLPRAAFGERSNDDALTPDSFALATANGGSGGGPAATHLVVEAADPRSALRVARTYFFSRGAVSPDPFAGALQYCARGRHHPALP